MYALGGFCFKTDDSQNSNHSLLPDRNETIRLIGDIALVTLAFTVTTLTILQANGVNLGALSCIGTIGLNGVVVSAGVGVMILALNAGKILIQQGTQIQKLEQKLQQAEEKAATYKEVVQENASLRKEKEDLDGQVEKLEEENAQYKNAKNVTEVPVYRNMQKELSETTQSLNELKEELRGVKADHAKLKQENGNAALVRAENAALQEELRKANEKTKESEQNLENLSHYVGDLEKTVLWYRIDDVDFTLLKEKETEINEKLEIENSIEFLEKLKEEVKNNTEKLDKLYFYCDEMMQIEGIEFKDFFLARDDSFET